MEKARAHIYVEGRVQGVFFRADVREIAESLSIKGWVRNTPDGRVEIIAEGGQRELRDLAKWCSKGSHRAHVEKADIMWEKPTGEFENFSINTD